MPLNGHSYLVAQGWSGHGKGLREGSISRPLAIPQKRTLAGLGKDRDEAFPFWDHLFNAAAKSIQVKIFNDDDDSNTDNDGTPSLPGLHRTSTGLLSNRRPNISTASSSGAATPDASSEGFRLSLLATAKREAAKRGLYARFFRGPVLGPDTKDVEIDVQVSAVTSTSTVTQTASHTSDKEEDHPEGTKRKKRKSREESSVKKESKPEKRKSEKEKKSRDKSKDKGKGKATDNLVVEDTINAEIENDGKDKRTKRKGKDRKALEEDGSVEEREGKDERKRKRKRERDGATDGPSAGSCEVSSKDKKKRVRRSEENDTEKVVERRKEKEDRKRRKEEKRKRREVKST